MALFRHVAMSPHNHPQDIVGVSIFLSAGLRFWMASDSEKAYR
jgi:hypothetical protein